MSQKDAIAIIAGYIAGLKATAGAVDGTYVLNRLDAEHKLFIETGVAHAPTALDMLQFEAAYNAGAFRAPQPIAAASHATGTDTTLTTTDGYTVKLTGSRFWCATDGRSVVLTMPDIVRPELAQYSTLYIIPPLHSYGLGVWLGQDVYSLSLTVKINDLVVSHRVAAIHRDVFSLASLKSAVNRAELDQVLMDAAHASARSALIKYADAVKGNLGTVALVSKLTGVSVDDSYPNPENMAVACYVDGYTPASGLVVGAKELREDS